MDNMQKYEHQLLIPKGARKVHHFKPEAHNFRNTPNGMMHTI